MIQKETEQDICKDYLQNEKIRIIANDYNVSQATVMAVLRRNNIPFRDKKRVVKDVENAIISFYEEGKPIDAICRLTGVKSSQTIYRVLREYDVKRRRNR
ncbi:hypothetical protein DW083_20210 [Parabacteroides sp. AF48-14]|uniref:hypothetical protein n=1 Tax=Parabacteroides sp. AF48-14 TaxID=2292052 RepID=UPI000EFEB613|nr:hypothetical protein [Parabacteroides sp. AF48-14]RHO65700.1 hypothetical protein DW083_20210 [Parabacteroides sp. AF48-14]